MRTQSFHITEQKPHEIEVIFTFGTFQKTEFSIIALVRVEQLVIFEEAPSAPLRERKTIPSFALDFRLLKPSYD